MSIFLAVLHANAMHKPKKTIRPMIIIALLALLCLALIAGALYSLAYWNAWGIVK